MKGAGVDCATFLLEVLRESGLVLDEETGMFSQDWWLHTTEEKYMLGVLRHAHKVVTTRCYRTLQVDPGNIILTKAAGSRVFNHGAIVLEYPKLAHAIHPEVEEIDASRHPMFAFMEIAVFDPFKSVEL